MQEKQLSLTSDEELSDEQLESVVGGKESKSSTTVFTNRGVTKKVFRTSEGDIIKKIQADVYLEN